ncbi:MAG: imidazole glycerol phosphate synthase subunit HisH [Candidatus Limnocylindrales bacterium]
MTTIAVVDYGAGNLISIENALERVGAEVRRASTADDLAGIDAIVVPGVGASGPAMARLRRRGLESAIRGAVAEGTWYLGVCLGMQLLFERSSEDGARLFGFIGGDVRPIPNAPRLPHIGWNGLERVRDHPLLSGIADGAPAYFVHSYAGVPRDPGIIVAETEHGGRFSSVIAAERLLGIQCHPERSGADGLRFLANFVGLVRAS